MCLDLTLAARCTIRSKDSASYYGYLQPAISNRLLRCRFVVIHER